MVFSGSLSLASLASLLLPDASRPFLYACCALLSLGYLLSLVTRRCQRVRQRLMGGSPPPLLRVDTRGSNPRNSVTFFAVVGLNSRVNATTGPYIAASDSSGLDIQIVKTVFFVVAAASPLSLMTRSKCSDLLMLWSWLLLIFSMIEECYINFIV
ncbi:hypothetical protein CK203_045603 [Vitis vinifera]|uniref:Uncharacterized protein n=1 Tax=Vitis vinifera TaxID=29760 RepID=A0A438HQ48_VITVI|nr:hypothetical protein CK203_045603 [Vitis vinifera]